MDVLAISQVQSGLMEILCVCYLVVTLVTLCFVAGVPESVKTRWRLLAVQIGYAVFALGVGLQLVLVQAELNRLGAVIGHSSEESVAMLVPKMPVTVLSGFLILVSCIVIVLMEVLHRRSV